MTRRASIALAAVLSLAACATGPDDQRPEAIVPASFKEAPVAAGATWYPAAPADALERGPWWQLFGDAQLDALLPQVEVSNQNVAAAVAAYAQAEALVREQRASLFPAVSADASARRAGGGGSSASFGTGARGAATSLQLDVGASWAPDLWGRLRRGVEAAQASASASAADLAAARLSAQGQVATNYFSLRDADAELALLARTVEGYARALQITGNRYDAGIAPRTDVLQAQTQLDNARADFAALTAQRAQLEHAIAVLLGRAPADFALPPGTWNTNVPAIPLGLPSQLLQRRPDIASAERAVAAANAQIGVARSAYYPSLTLSGTLGRGASNVADLFGAPANLWSLGLAAAQTLFDAGATDARVEAAGAVRDAAAARYRQTVLTAFQAVEDQLAAMRALAEQAERVRSASQAADLAEQQMLNRYQAGQVGYTDVVTAQAAALAARRNLAQITARRQAAAIALIQALGGGWQAR